jgi:hypothetical protein
MHISKVRTLRSLRWPLVFKRSLSRVGSISWLEMIGSWKVRRRKNKHRESNSTSCVEKEREQGGRRVRNWRTRRGENDHWCLTAFCLLSVVYQSVDAAWLVFKCDIIEKVMSPPPPYNEIPTLKCIFIAAAHHCYTLSLSLSSQDCGLIIKVQTACSVRMQIC